jgi:outer membrane receptor protein involved in Fe transport
MNYIGGWSINDPSGGQANACDGAFAGFSLTYSPPGPFPNGVTNTNLCQVASFTEFDLYGSYKLNKHLSFHGSVLNVFAREPPLDISTYGGGGGGLYSSGMHQIGATGRFYTVGLAYDF